VCSSDLPCTVCHEASRLIAARRESHLYRCGACDHCFSGLETMPEAEQYGAEYYNEKHRAWFENPNTKLFDFIFEQIRRVKTDASVIDVGAGRGDLLRFLRAKDSRLSLTGVDLSPIAPAEGITFLQGDALALRLGRRFDAVVSLAVIEHVLDVHKFARGLSELCAPGGIVIIMTLNDRSLLYAAARLMRGLGLDGPFDRLYEKHHINHFNISSLRRLLETHQLRQVKIHYHNIPMAAVDMPAASALTSAVFRVGIRGAFILGSLLRRTYLQTVVCRRKES
jgi:SAM-dependent methyltransferase